MKHYGVPITQRHFLIPKLLPMILFIYQYNNLKQQNHNLKIETIDVKQWMNRFHETAVCQGKLSNYSETIIHAMDQVHKKAMPKELLLNPWREALNEMGKKLPPLILLKKKHKKHGKN